MKQIINQIRESPYIKPIALISFFLGFIPILLVLRKGWIEPDSFAHYLAGCRSFDNQFLLPLSKILIENITCSSIFNWYILTGLMALFSLSVLAWFCEKKKIPIHSIGIIGLSLASIYFSIALEDEQLIMPLFLLVSLWYSFSENKDYLKYLLFILLVGIFFWKGALFIGLIILFSKMHPLLGAIPFIGYFWESGFGFNSLGGSTEGNILSGLVTALPIIFILFYVKKEAIALLIREKQTLFFTWAWLAGLGLYQAKFAYLSLIYLPFVFYYAMKDNPQFLRLAQIGMVCFFLGTTAILVIKEPTSIEWGIVEDAVHFQSQGFKLYNSWQYGYWIAYKGGLPSDWGGNHGFVVKDNNFYWLGDERPNCELVKRSGLMVLEFCEKSTV